MVRSGIKLDRPVQTHVQAVWTVYSEPVFRFLDRVHRVWRVHGDGAPGLQQTQTRCTRIFLIISEK